MHRSSLSFLIVAVLSATLLAHDDAPARPERITLERTACYGWCPQYRITVAADGRAEFAGVGYAIGARRLDPEMPLRDSMRVSAAAVRRVQRAFDDALSRFLPNRITQGSVACGPPADDHATVRLTREAAARHDTIELYLGCSIRPARILRAAAVIDSVTNVAHWLGPRDRP